MNWKKLHDDRKALHHMGQVLILPEANSGQIRDGPMRHHPRLSRQLTYCDRKAA